MKPRNKQSLPVFLEKSLNRRPARVSRKRRLLYESLETRRVLANFMVDSLDDVVDADDEVLSLREAIISANGNSGPDTITFEASLFTGGAASILLTMGELQITDSVTITGPGQELLTVNANQLSRVLNVAGGTQIDVTLDGLTLTGGRTTGSNSFVNGNLETTHSGGGIRFDSIGTLTLTGSTVVGNSTAGDRAQGGGMFTNSGVVMLTGSTVSGNSTERTFADGGGIYASSGAVTLTSSTLSGNSTAGDLADGGGIFSSSGAVTLTGSRLSGNSTAGDGASGGGIFASSGATTLTESTLSENRTAGNSAAGGGMFARSGAVTLSGSTLSGNSTAGAFADGGGILARYGAVTLTGSIVSGNSTAGIYADGGGMYARSGAVTLTGSTLSGNQVTGTDSDGGGVWFDNSVVTIVNSTITDNSARRAGGGFHVRADATDKKLTIHNSIIAANAADSNPDFTAPNAPETNLEARFSLIGNNQGTSLTESATADTNGNLIGTHSALLDAKLGPLQDNGGATQTHALLADSPAIDAGSNALVPTDVVNDGRGSGFPRISGGTVDIGALEVAADLLDFGDAPAIYPVTLAQNGARHTIGELLLGTSVDFETDGTPNNDANADGTDDGVFWVSTFFSSTVATTSSFIVIASGAGKLDGWIDFNDDGDWLDPDEQIYSSRDVSSGQNVLAFTIPAGASVSTTGARFRLSTIGGLAPTGAAADGEVEDYIATIISGSPTAILDLDLPGGDSSLIVEGNNLVVRRGGVKIVEVPLAEFATLHVSGTNLEDLFQLTILEALATEVLRFDGGLGKDFLSLVEAGQTLDLTSARIRVTDIEGIDIRGTGDNMLVINIDAVKLASTTTDTLEVIADFGDQILLGDGWTALRPEFVAGEFTHIVSETAPSGTARVEIRNDRWFQNPLNRFDVSRDGQVTASDALRIINELGRRGGSGLLAIPTNDGEISNLYVDVSGDDSISAVDALQIINALARINSGVQPQGEAVINIPPLASIDCAGDHDSDHFDAAILAFVESPSGTLHATSSTASAEHPHHRSPSDPVPRRALDDREVDQEGKLNLSLDADRLVGDPR